MIRCALPETSRCEVSIALGLERVDLVEQDPGVDDDAVADHRGHRGVEHPRGHELQREGLAVDDDAVPRVVAALVADDDVHLLGEEVGELALALVTPLGADHDGCWQRVPPRSLTTNPTGGTAAYPVARRSSRDRHRGTVPSADTRRREDEMVEDLVDERRREPPFVLGEREMLEEWLEFHRITLLLKCEGLDRRAAQAPWRPDVEALAARARPPHGRGRAELVRPRPARASPRPASYFATEGVEDSELVPLDDAVWEDDLEVWRDGVQHEPDDRLAQAARRHGAIRRGAALHAAVDLRPHDRGVRAAQRARGPPARARRRRRRLVTQGDPQRSSRCRDEASTSTTTVAPSGSALEQREARGSSTSALDHAAQRPRAVRGLEPAWAIRAAAASVTSRARRRSASRVRSRPSWIPTITSRSSR